ncbi:uncharacterized protein LOC144112886 [Amblyomma americanum]
MESTTTLLHEEQCPVDEYPVAKEVMRAIQNTDPMCFGALTSGPQFVEQKRSPQEICEGRRRVQPDREKRRIRVPVPDIAPTVQLWWHTLPLAAQFLPVGPLLSSARPWGHSTSKST